jgi:hypothetical protein
MDATLLLIAAIACCFFCCRGLFVWGAGHRISSRGPSRGDSPLSATAGDLQQRVEVLERIATDRKTALREKFLDLE